MRHPSGVDNIQMTTGRDDGTAVAVQACTAQCESAAENEQVTAVLSGVNK